MDLRVRLTGTFQVLRGPGRTDVAIGSPKERRLLAMLAAHRGHDVAADRLADVLWSEHPTARPAADVATLVSRLRSRLGPEAVLGDRSGYRLGAPPAVCVDLDEASDLVTEATRRLAAGTPGLATAAGRRALDLVDGGEPLPAEPDAPWAASVRDEWRELVRRGRHVVGEAALGAGDTATARRAAQEAVAADRFDETAVRLLLATHQAAGEPARGLACFERLRAALAEELGVEPAPVTRDCHLAVLREEPVPGPRAAPVTRAATLPDDPRNRGPWAGRAEETARLTALWEHAVDGWSGLVLLAGEAGIGKTRLAREVEALARATGGTVASGRCWAAERSLFLQPVVDALRSTLADLDPDAVRAAGGPHAAVLADLWPELAHPLGVAGPGNSADRDARRTFTAIVTLLRAVATPHPLLLVLDDLHNAGLATVELLHHVARMVGPSRLLVLATVRVEEGADTLLALGDLGDLAVRVDLGPLSDTAVAEIAARAGQAPRAGNIARRTRGHPLFVTEVLRGLVAGEPGIPATLREAVLARVARAGPDIEELVRAASVLGAAVDPGVLAGLLDLPPAEVARRCEGAVGARLLVDAGRSFEFANDLVHEVLYATTATPIRRWHHRRAADLLTVTPEAVAEHAAAIDDWPRAGRALLLAGEAAARRAALGDAEVLLGRALEAAGRAGDDPELAGRVLLLRGRVREALGAYPGAWGDLRDARSAAREAGDRRLEMTVLRELGGDVPIALGRAAAEGTDHLRAGLRLARSFGDRGAEADVRARLAVQASHRLAFTEAIEQGELAVAAGRAAGDDRAVVVGLDGLKTARAYLGQVRELAEIVEEMEPLARRIGERLLHWTVFESAFPEVAAGRYDEARARIDESVAVTVRGGYEVHGTFLVAHQGWVARLQGDLDEALVLGRDAAARSARSAHRWWWATAQGLLATTHLARGEDAEARTVAAAALQRLGPDEVAAARLRCLAPLAEASRDQEVLAAAQQLLQEVVAPPGSAWLLGADAYFSVARACLRHGHPDRARAVLAPVIIAAERHGWGPLLDTGRELDRRAVRELPAR